MRVVGSIIRFLRAPRTALAILAFQAAYATAAVWIESLSFSSPLFIASVCVLFLSTFVCTIERTRVNLALTRGAVRTYGVSLPRRDRADAEAFLRSAGFGGNGPTLFRNRVALWGGWVLHAGVLALLFGILVQQALHDGGAFDLSEGEIARLSDPGVVFGRAAGMFAAATPPAVDVGLLAFDPFFHQKGYAPDRASRVVISGREAFVDRARGVSSAGVTVYQAIPTSLAVVLEIPGAGMRSVHLAREGERRASADLKDLRDDCLRLVAVSERTIGDPQGTGRIDLFVERRGHRQRVDIGKELPFGGTNARVITISRWARFTYSRSPGMPLVFAGFLIVLAGSALLTLPSGVALLTNDEHVAASVYMKRGADVLLHDWSAWDGGTATEIATAPELLLLTPEH